MRNSLLTATLLTLLYGTPTKAAQSEISTKLGKVADTLLATYQNSPGAKPVPKAAVLTFNTTKELRKQRIGFAVSEILTHKLAAKGGVTLVERTELNSVMEELKLNMSGVTGQQEALSVGKLAHADILMLGSVEEFGADYHINSRLVNAETGEVMATAYETISTAAFEKEAGEYVLLVPKAQAIGIYFLYNYSASADLSSKSGTVSAPPRTYTTTIDPISRDFWFAGLGVRYSPSERIMLDVSYSKSASMVTTAARRTQDDTGGDYSMKLVSNFTYLRFLAGTKGNIWKNFSYFAGGGATSVRIGLDASTNYLTPTLLVRAELRPQERVGISLAAGYNATTKAAKMEDFYGNFKVVQLQHFYLEPSVSVYF